MIKKLKIQFWRAELALAMQILEQEGNFRDSGHVYMGLPELCCDRIYLCDEDECVNLGVVARNFNTNASRDEYLKTVIRWISEEQFGKNNEGMLKIGEMCEVWHPVDLEWQERKLLALLPENYEERFIVSNFYYPNRYVPYSVARPIAKRTKPTIEECGQLITYTWEEK